MTQEQQPEALRLANSITWMDTFTDYQREELDKAAAELRSQHDRIAELENERDRHRDAHREWNDKTDWVQGSSQAHELGKHRADVLRERIVRLQSELDAALEVAEANAKSGAAWSARVQELEAQLEAIGAGGVEPLRRRECLHKISEPAHAPANGMGAADTRRVLGT